MAEMSHTTFQQACDKLSSTVDADQFERFRWSRDEAPRLAHLVKLVKEAVGDRTDVEINEEGGAHANKRFVIKAHGQRVAGLGVALDKGRAVVAIGPVERSRFVVKQGGPIHIEIDRADEAWMGETLAALMGRVSAPETPQDEASEEAEAGEEPTAEPEETSGPSDQDCATPSPSL